MKLKKLKCQIHLKAIIHIEMQILQHPYTPGKKHRIYSIQCNGNSHTNINHIFRFFTKRRRISPTNHPTTRNWSFAATTSQLLLFCLFELLTSRPICGCDCGFARKDDSQTSTHARSMF